MRIVIRGSASVVKNHLEDDEEAVTTPDVLRMIASKDDALQELYDDEMAFSNFVDDGSPQGNAVAGAVAGSGWVRLAYDEQRNELCVETEYVADRELSETEMEYLVRETLGQWSDGGGATAIDDFSEQIAPYYVTLNAVDPADVHVSQRPA